MSISYWAEHWETGNEGVPLDEAEDTDFETEYIDCKRCHGLGESPEGEWDCEHCDGLGAIPLVG